MNDARPTPPDPSPALPRALSRLGALFTRRGTPADRPSRGDEGAPSEGQRLRQAHSELQALLDRHPDARRTLRHLAFFEGQLGRLGKRVFQHDLPTAVFERSLAQLETLMRVEDGAGLQLLHRRLTAALRERRGARKPAASEGVTVSEASHSLFDEMERSWTGTLPSVGPAAPSTR